MNAPATFPSAELDAKLKLMEGNASRWRGDCVQSFAELEQIVDGLLIALKSSKKHGGKVKPAKMIGSAFDHLRELTGSKGALAAKGKAISTTLAELAPWFEWRAHLTHGALTVWRGRNDHWLIALAHRHHGEDPVRTFALTWEDAQRLRKLLAERVHTLSDNARSLQNSVRTA